MKVEKLAWFQFLAVVAAIGLILSVYPLQNKYLSVFFGGVFLCAIAEWAQWSTVWEQVMVRGRGVEIMPHHEKNRTVFWVAIQIISAILIIAPVVELITRIQLIPSFF